MPELRDFSGNRIFGSVTTGHMIQIGTSLTNEKNSTQKFAYIVLIEDKDGVRMLISWINGTLNAGQTIQPEQYWTPTKWGSYEAYIFFWQSRDDPTSIQPPISTAIEVCDAGLVAVMTIHENSLTCLKPDDAEKFVKNGLGSYY